MAVKPPTKTELSAAGFVNAHDFYDAEPYLFYGSQSVARTDHPVWYVIKRGVKLSTAWYDDGAKVIWVERGDAPFATRKAAALTVALRFATKQFGITNWVKGPFNSYGPAAFVEARSIAIREGRCYRDRESGRVITTTAPAKAGKGTPRA